MVNKRYFIKPVIISHLITASSVCFQLCPFTSTSIASLRTRIYIAQRFLNRWLFLVILSNREPWFSCYSKNNSCSPSTLPSASQLDVRITAARSSAFLRSVTGCYGRSALSTPHTLRSLVLVIKQPNALPAVYLQRSYKAQNFFHTA